VSAPPPTPSALTRWRAELFGSAPRAITSLLLLGLGGWALLRALDWALLQAVFAPDLGHCRALDHAGACWGVVAEKHRAILFGRYPHEQQWRPALATLLLLGLLLASAWPRSWRAGPLGLALLWAGVLSSFVLLMGGGLGLEAVPTSRWGGLPLSLLLACVGLGVALPLGVLLALARRATGWPVLQMLAASYIELIRGVPLISVLFMASFLLPLLLPWQPDVLLRVLIGISLFAAAYLAEVVRGGLQNVPVGQIEAARALGLQPWQVQREIVLPQALRAVVPALMNSVIGTLKDTSLVTIVGLYELTGALGLALGGDADWRPFYLEGYLFIAAIYWSLCFALSRYSRWIEARLRAS
jgi:general L-amino acid transport system permease protein